MRYANRKTASGIWHLDLLGTADEDADDERTLKTNGSHRLVALHQDLIDLGFIDYAQSLPAGGQLFPALKANPDGYYGHNFGKQWEGTCVRLPSSIALKARLMASATPSRPCAELRVFLRRSMMRSPGTMTEESADNMASATS